MTRSARSRGAPRPRAWFLAGLLLSAAGMATPESARHAPLEPPRQSPADLLPPPGALDGWAPVEAARTFSEADLWQHIDGAAEQYLSFGCAALAVGYYGAVTSPAAPASAGPGAAEIMIEIYWFREDLGSFGLYSLERPPDVGALEIGAQGYQAGSDLNFFGGPYYVKLRCYPEDERTLAGARDVAASIARTHLLGSRFPPQLDVFPQGNLVANSFAFVPRAVLGVAGLDAALAARYRRPGGDDDPSAAPGAPDAATGEMTLYLMRRQDRASAQAAFDLARDALTRRATAGRQDVSIASATGVRAELRYHGTVLLLQRDADLLLSAGGGDEPWAVAVITQLLDALEP